MDHTTTRVGEGARLHSAEFFAGDPHAVFRHLRREDPVYRYEYEHGAFWAVTKHSDVIEVGRSPHRFSSAPGLLMPGPETDPLNAMLSGSLIASDPPDHTELRQAVAPLFRAPAVTALEERIRRHTSRLFDEVPTGEPFDLVERLAARIPSWVIGELMGIPDADRDHFRELVDAAVAYSDPQAAFDETGASAVTAAFGYLADLVEQRRRSPGVDLVSALISARVGGEPLDDFRLVQSSFVVLTAGTETTRTLIAQGTRALIEQRAALEHLRRSAAIPREAIEELLRWISPVTHFARTATGDTDLRGRRIADGDVVVLFFLSANRDEDVFGEDADVLRLGRSPNPHLAFGVGDHFCLGAALARLETRVFFEELLRRFSRIEMAGEPEVLITTHIAGLKTLPVILR